MTVHLTYILISTQNVRETFASLSSELYGVIVKTFKVSPIGVTKSISTEKTKYFEIYQSYLPYVVLEQHV